MVAAFEGRASERGHSVGDAHLQGILRYGGSQFILLFLGFLYIVGVGWELGSHRSRETTVEMSSDGWSITKNAQHQTDSSRREKGNAFGLDYW